MQRQGYRWANWWQRQHVSLSRARTQVARWRDMWPNVRPSADVEFVLRPDGPIGELLASLASSLAQVL